MSLYLLRAIKYFLLLYKIRMTLLRLKTKTQNKIKRHSYIKINP